MKKIGLFCKKYAYMIAVAVFAAIICCSGIIIFCRSVGSARINEVCTSNVSCCEDADGNYPDWIELYNPTDMDMDLSGFTLNKSADTNKEKYVIPDGTVLGPGSFFLLDPGFTMSSKGCSVNLLNRKKQYVDHVYIPALEYDTTYSRSEDGSGKWEIMTPTPGYSNSDAEPVDPVIEGSVIASKDTGFYEDEIDIDLVSSNWGRKILYTTDGADPRKSGIEYNGPIHVEDKSDDIDRCTVVRAVAVDLLGRYTRENRYVYFVGFDKKTAYDNMTVLSVAADPDDLFSYENGIMVPGIDYDMYVAAGEPEEYDTSKANFTRRGRTSEREIRFDVFDEGHKLILDTNAGIRIKGLSSRWDDQKSFSVFFRQAYGGRSKASFTTDDVDFSLHSLAIDKCGQDTATKMVDAIMGYCMQYSGCAVAKRVPCCLFINGDYAGFYWLTERFDRTFFADRYGVDAEDVEVIDKEDFTSGDEWGIDNFDRESLLEYYASNVIVAHDGDWPDFNVRFWRTGSDEGTEYGNAKMRPIIFDMNSRSMKSPGYDPIEYMLENFYPFQKLTGEDDGFRQDLVEKIDEMSSNEFERQKVLELIDDLQDRMEEQMILDRMRYSDCSAEEARESFDKSVDVIRKFFMERWDHLDDIKEKYLNG
ncbi:MAG: CotH kinase family protein [Lachnospiraceae bacterium]|nr:CotH kinase family protein [Lachnospiraceae bacterium]